MRLHLPLEFHADGGRVARAWPVRGRLPRGATARRPSSRSHEPPHGGLEAPTQYWRETARRSSSGVPVSVYVLCGGPWWPAWKEDMSTATQVLETKTPNSGVPICADCARLPALGETLVWL